MDVNAEIDRLRLAIDSWTDETPVHEQLALLRDLRRVRRAQERRPRRHWLTGVAQALRPRERPGAPVTDRGRSRYERRAAGLTLAAIADQDGVTDGAIWQSIRDYAERCGLPMPTPKLVPLAAAAARAIGISEHALWRLNSKGLLPSAARNRYAIDDIRAELSRLGWSPGRAAPGIYNPNTKRGAAVLARRSERAAGLATCCGCREKLPLDRYPPSSLRRGHWVCRDCRRPAKRATDARRRGSKRDTQIAQVDLRVVAERDGWKCAICADEVSRETWSLDHVVPLSKGGPHTYENVVLAHRSCNSKRGAGRFPVEATVAAVAS